MNHKYYENLQKTDLPNEKWIDCIGYDGIYAVSNLGRVKGLERWRETRPGIGYMMQESIRKQSISKKCSGIRTWLCQDGKVKPFMTSRLVFFSFNYNVPNLKEYFVVHKDNDFTNNRLENLKIGTREEIGILTFEHGKIDHLKLGNPMLSKHNRKTAIIKNNEIVEKKCTKCKKYKTVSEFRIEHNECKYCQYFGRNNIDRQKGFKVQTTNLKTKEIIIYKNFNDRELRKIMSVSTAMKYAKSGQTYKSYRCSKKKNIDGLLIKQLNEN